MAPIECRTLSEVVRQIYDLPHGATIAVRKPWGAESDSVVVVPADEEHDDPDLLKGAKAEGYSYFLEIFVATEVLGAFGERGREPSLEEKVRLLLYYAEHDAFPDWVYE